MKYLLLSLFISISNFGYTQIAYKITHSSAYTKKSLEKDWDLTLPSVAAPIGSTLVTGDFGFSIVIPGSETIQLSNVKNTKNDNNGHFFTITGDATTDNGVPISIMFMLDKEKKHNLFNVVFLQKEPNICLSFEFIDKQ